MLRLLGRLLWLGRLLRLVGWLWRLLRRRVGRMGLQFLRRARYLWVTGACSTDGARAARNYRSAQERGRDLADAESHLRTSHRRVARKRQAFRGRPADE